MTVPDFKQTADRTRVLFVIGSMGGGGAERQILEILKRLDRSRYEPLLYLSSKQGDLLDEVPSDVPIFAYWDGTPETFFGKVLRWMKLTQFLRHIHLANALQQNRINVVYDRTYLATLESAGGCWLRPTPRISCCVADPTTELKLHAKLSVSLSKWYARRAYRSANVVLTNSEGLRHRFLECFRLDPDHVKVFYNLLADVRETGQTGVKDVQQIKDFFESSDPTSQTGPIDPSMGHGNRPFLIANTSRLHHQKGHLTLLQAIDELVNRRQRSLKLIIFGQGETESELKEFVKSRGLTSHVAIAGFVADPRHWYRHADLFVFPSLFEGMPNALIEAVACGVPALSADCPSGPAEILDYGRCGRLVPPGDAIALANQIEDAMDHPEDWLSRAGLGQQRVKEMFDPETGIRRLESLIDSIAQRRDEI